MEKITTPTEVEVSPVVSTTVTADEAQLTLWQAVKKWRKVVLYCLTLSTAVILYGYDQAIVGSISGIPAFQRDFGETLSGKLILPSLWLALWNVGTPIGIMVGGICGGFTQDLSGRRIAIAISSFVAAIGIAIMFCCFVSDDVTTRRVLFFAGKLVQGVGIGMIMSTTQTYMSEVLPPILRGPVLSFLTIFTLFGQLIGAVVVFSALQLTGSRSYTTCFASQWPLSLATLIASFVIPESPTHLIRKNQMDKAYKAQTRLNEPGADTASVLERLRISIAAEKQLSKSTYQDCFKGTNGRRTWIIIVSCFLPQSFGLTLLAKSAYFLQVVGMQAKTSVMMVLVGIVVGLFANLGSFWTLSRFGRRQLILIPLSATALVWTSVGIAGCFSGTPTVWYTAIGMLSVIVLSGLGTWPASGVVHPKHQLSTCEPKLRGDLKAKTGFVYGALSAFGVLATWFVIPEMKGRDFVVIDEMFDRKIRTRHFEMYDPADPVARIS